MFDFLKIRSNQEELMDDFECHGEVVHQTLRELHNINTYLGGNQLSVNALKKLCNTRVDKRYSVADIGCGGGEMLRVFDQWSHKANINLDLVGIDANQHIIDYANKHVNAPNISFQCLDILSPEFQTQEFDIIHCSLFLHHFTGDQIVSLLQQLKHQARVGIIVNDLHRHWISYYFTKYLIVSWSKSAMVKYDSVVSVARSFTRNELLGYLSDAGIKNFILKWKWAFRWQLVITNQNL